MSDITRSIYAPLVREFGPNHNSDIDLGRLLRLLLLFDKVYVESRDLADIVALCESIGLGGLMELIDSGALRICVNQPILGVASDGNFLQNEFDFCSISVPKNAMLVSHNLDKIRSSEVLDQLSWKPLKRRLVDSFRNTQSGDSSNALQQTRFDVSKNLGLVEAAITVAASREGIILRDGCSVEVQAGKGTHLVSTDLERNHSVDSATGKLVVRNALAGILQLNAQLEAMRILTATSGFAVEALPLAQAKIHGCINLNSNNELILATDQIIGLSGLPDVDENLRTNSIDVPNLVKIRASSEWRDFTLWIRESTISPESFGREFGGLREKMARLSQSKTTRTVRFLLSAGGNIGLVPGAASVIDSVIFKLIGSPKPVSFLAKKYPSLFQPARQGSASV